MYTKKYNTPTAHTPWIVQMQEQTWINILVFNFPRPLDCQSTTIGGMKPLCPCGWVYFMQGDFTGMDSGKECEVLVMVYVLKEMNKAALSGL